MTRPTVGRIVWYHPLPDDPGVHGVNVPLAAIIAFVHSEVMVNIVVFDVNGKPFNKTSVLLFNVTEVPDRPFGYAEWPTRSV